MKINGETEIELEKGDLILDFGRGEHFWIRMGNHVYESLRSFPLNTDHLVLIKYRGPVSDYSHFDDSWRGYDPDESDKWIKAMKSENS